MSVDAAATTTVKRVHKLPDSGRRWDQMAPKFRGQVISRLPFEAGKRAHLDDSAAQVRDLRKSMRELGLACNQMVDEFIGYHHAARTMHILRANPAATVCCIDDDCARAMYQAACLAAPSLPVSVVANTFHWLKGEIARQSSARNDFKRWRLFLAGQEDRPYFAAQPIRLHDKVASFFSEHGHLWLRIQWHKDHVPHIIRIRRPSRSEGVNAAQYRERYNLAALNGQLGGAQLLWNGRGFELALCVNHEAPELPNLPDLDPRLKLRIECATDAVFTAIWQGQTAKLFQEELIQLGKTRQAVIAARQKYKLARKAAGSRIGPRDAFMSEQRSRWKNYCTTLSQRLARKIVDAAAKHGATQIEFVAGEPDCALARCGVEKEIEATQYRFADFHRFLENAATLAGIVVTYTANLRSPKRRKEVRDAELAQDQL